jgi:ABC-type Zn uptake system ZnuABC Zn-binding protein ZnuA
LAVRKIAGHGRGHVAAIGFLIVVASLAAACSGPGGGRDREGLLVVTTVSPITDLARQVAGEAAGVEGIVPEGVDSHTFEPTPSSARLLAQADLILVNGLHLEDPTIRLAEANKREDARIVELGDRTVSEDEYIFDFSFPESEGKPNPHLWMDPVHAIGYVELIRDELSRADPDSEETYRRNADRYAEVLEALDRAIAEAVQTIPERNRALLTFHDSFAYPARRYGLRVIGAIQPSDFSEPSAAEVASLIDQIREEDVPAIFGSEVFPSPVLEQIAKEGGARFESTLRDDDLPGEPGDPEHSYLGLMVYDFTTIVRDLGGDPAALEEIGP